MNTKLCHVILKTHLELEDVTRGHSAYATLVLYSFCHLNGIMLFARIL